VAMGNGAGLAIENTGSSTLLSFHFTVYNSKFKIKDILHCSTASTNLLYVQKKTIIVSLSQPHLIFFL